MSGEGKNKPPVPPAPEVTLPKGTAYRFEDGALCISLPIDVYTLDAILRSCYRLTDRSYVYLAPPRGALIEVTLVAKEGGVGVTDQLAWDFLNDLVDQRLRIDINRETRTIREMIVAQAFAETDLIDDQGDAPTDVGENHQQGGNDDPKGIRTWRPAS